MKNQRTFRLHFNLKLLQDRREVIKGCKIIYRAIEEVPGYELLQRRQTCCLLLGAVPDIILK